MKSTSFYWRKKIADYQSTLNRYRLKTSRRLRRMYKKWRRQIRDYVNWVVRSAMEWLYWRRVSRVVVGHPKYIAQNSSKSSKITR